MRREEREMLGRKVLRGRYMWTGGIVGTVLGAFAGNALGNMGVGLGLGVLLGMVVGLGFYHRN